MKTPLGPPDFSYKIKQPKTRSYDTCSGEEIDWMFVINSTFLFSNFILKSIFTREHRLFKAFSDINLSMRERRKTTEYFHLPSVLFSMEIFKILHGAFLSYQCVCMAVMWGWMEQRWLMTMHAGWMIRTQLPSKFYILKFWWKNTCKMKLCTVNIPMVGNRFRDNP